MEASLNNKAERINNENKTDRYKRARERMQTDRQERKGRRETEGVKSKESSGQNHLIGEIRPLPKGPKHPKSKARSPGRNTLDILGEPEGGDPSIFHLKQTLKILF